MSSPSYPVIQSLHDHAMKESAPEYLYRVTYSDKLQFDENGYLLPHREENFLSILIFHGMIPMVTVQDLEFIARYFAINIHDFLKLTISSEHVEGLETGRHSYLKGLEYFGKVHRSAIVCVEQCNWEGGRFIIRQDQSHLIEQ